MAVEKKYLVVNIGSASKKYAFYSGEMEVLSIHLDKHGSKIVSNLVISGFTESSNISVDEYDNSAGYVINVLLSRKVINGKGDISAVGFRIVSPGEFFLENKIIDSRYISKLKNTMLISPLHIEPTLLEINSFRKILPGVSFVGVSDSVFHNDMPKTSKIYAISPTVASKFGIYRYGYHGISFQAIVSKIKSSFRGVPRNVIICHLGGGCSITALKDSKSFDTSMGFTPLEGVFGGTRIGDIDAGAVIYLSKVLNLNLKNIEDYFSNKTGMFGLSGSSDIRDILSLAKNNKNNGKLTLDYWIYKIKKYIGSYVASLNGFDMLVFSGTIGERSPEVRSMICSDMNYFGLQIDEHKNSELKGEGFIHKDSSKVKILVVKSDEIGVIAKETSRVLGF